MIDERVIYCQDALMDLIFALVQCRGNTLIDQPHNIMKRPLRGSGSRLDAASYFNNFISRKIL